MSFQKGFVKNVNFVLISIENSFSVYILIFIALGVAIESVNGLLKCPGPCMDPQQCRLLGGKILGYCINEEACCDQKQNGWGSCGSVYNVRKTKVSYFRSPNYPMVSGGDLLCTFQLDLDPSTTGVRIDYLDLKMDSVPSNPAEYIQSPYPLCDSDMMFIKGFKNWSPDPRCGNLTGYSILVETEEMQKSLSLLMVMSSSEYKWNIRLTEISQLEVNRLHGLIYNKMTLDEENNMKPEKSYLAGYPRPYAPGLPILMPPLLRPPFPYFRSVLNSTSEEIKQHLENSSTENDWEIIQPLPRIAGGENAEVNGIPWQVSIQSVEQAESVLCGEVRNMSIHVCGGSIVDERTILTAAHCFYSPSRFAHPTSSVANLKVVVGELDMCRSNEAEFTKEYSISRVILHFNYISTEIINDLAIIQLTQSIQFNQGVQPISLADQDINLKEETQIMLSGWGSFGLEENATFPSTLQKTSDLILMSVEECKQRQQVYLNFDRGESELPLKYRGAIGKGICARGKTDKVEAGYGDSGGPLVAFQPKSQQSSTSVKRIHGAELLEIPQLIGVVSHMRPEIDNNTNSAFHLDYFAKVSEFKKWILMGMINVQ